MRWTQGFHASGEARAEWTERWNQMASETAQERQRTDSTPTNLQVTCKNRETRAGNATEERANEERAGRYLAVRSAGLAGAAAPPPRPALLC